MTQKQSAARLHRVPQTSPFARLLTYASLPVLLASACFFVSVSAALANPHNDRDGRMIPGRRNRNHEVCPVRQYPGATYTEVYAINDNDTVAGGYKDSNGMEHAFFGDPVSGHYTSFDYGTNGTVALGINNVDDITGYANYNSYVRVDYVPFEYIPSGQITTIFAKNGHQLNGALEDINDDGSFSGWLVKSSDLHSKGYTGTSDTATFYLKNPEATGGIAPMAISNEDEVAGTYYDTSGHSHGFLLDKRGNTTTIDYPDSISTVIRGMTRNFLTGTALMSNGTVPGFWYNRARQRFNPIGGAEPQKTFTPYGVNSFGHVAVEDSQGKPYIYYIDGNVILRGAHYAVVNVR